MIKKMTNKMNKQAQEDSTIVWIGAIFIIIFILSLYLVVSFLMTEKKFWTEDSSAAINQGGFNKDVGLSEDFFSFLNSEVEFNGKKEKAIDAILFSLDAYFETKSAGVSLIDKYGLYNGEDISRVSVSKMESDGFKSEEIAKIKTNDGLLAEELKKQLDLHCIRYKLGIPQGLISEEGFRGADALGNRIFFNVGKDNPQDWNAAVNYNIIYRGKTMKIEYTQLKECISGKTIGE